MHISLSLIVDLIASGTTIPEILQDYPQLTQEDILTCLAYGEQNTP